MANGCPKLGNALTMAHRNQNELLVPFDLPMNYSTNVVRRASRGRQTTPLEVQKIVQSGFGQGRSLYNGVGVL